jgi:hypothetical protein
MFYAAAFVLFAFACMTLAFTRHPFFGLLFYMGSMYVHPPSRWWGYVVPDLRWALLSAAVTVLAVLVHRDRLAAKPLWLANAPAVLLSLYAAWMVVQIPWALDQKTHIEGTVQFIKYLVAFWFVYRIAESKEMLRNILIAHVAGCTLLGLYAQFTGRDGERLDGVGGPGMDDANTLGMYLATGVVIGLGLFLMMKGWVRWAVLGMVIIVLNGFVLANSRGSFLGLSAGLVVLMLCKARAHRRMFWAFVLAGVFGASMIVDKVFIERMFTIGDVTSQDEDAERSARSRMVIYEAQVRMAQDYPMGAGHRGTATLSPRYLDPEWLVRGGAEPDAERSSHNTFMTTLVEQGIPGALMFSILVLWVLGRIPRLRRLQREGADPGLITLGAAMCAALAVVIVAGSATDYLLAEVQFWMYAGLVSMLQMCARDKAPATAVRAATVPHSA